MIAPLRIVFKIRFQNIGKKEDFKDKKHHEQLDQNNQPDLLAPFGH
jgi:hypothetical protein